MLLLLSHLRHASIEKQESWATACSSLKHKASPCRQKSRRSLALPAYPSPGLQRRMGRGVDGLVCEMRSEDSTVALANRPDCNAVGNVTTCLAGWSIAIGAIFLGGTSRYCLTTMDRSMTRFPSESSDASMCLDAPDVKNNGCKIVATKLCLEVSA